MTCFFFMQKLSYCSLALILRNAQALRNWSVVTSFGPLYKGFKRDLQWTFQSMRKETIQIWGTGSYSRPSELMLYSSGLCDLGWPWKQYGPFSMPYFIFVCHFIDEWPWKKKQLGTSSPPPPPPLTQLLTNHWNISDLTLCPLLLSVIHIRHFQGLSLFSQIQIMVAMNTPQYMQPFIESNTSLWGIRNAISPCMFWNVWLKMRC